MRKSIYILAAAATILASCAKTEKISDGLKDTTEPKAIGFSSYSEKATKGVNDATDLEYYHNTFAVYGTKCSNNDQTIQYIFGDAPAANALNPTGTTCTYQGANPDPVLGDWKYTDPRFWDKQSTYDFIAYAPVSAANPIRYYYNAVGAEVADNGNEFKTSATYTLTGTNLQATATEGEKVKGFTVEAAEDLDLMISTSNPQNGTGHDNYVNLLFRHILSKLNISFSKSEVLQNADVVITEVTIGGLLDSGDYVETRYNNSTNPKVSGWSASEVDGNYTLQYSDSQELNDGSYEDTDHDAQTPDEFIAGKPYYFIESLVMPQAISDNQVTLIAKYTITSGGYDENYTYKLDLYDVENLRNFFDGYNYNLHFTIDPDVIKYDATVSTWTDQATINKVIE